MKLIHYTIAKLSFWVLIVMAFWTVFFYFQILNEVRDETDDSLKNYKKTIIKQALRDSSMLKSHVDILTRYYIKEIPEEEGRHYQEKLFSTEAFNEYEMEDEPVRVLKTAFRSGAGQYYELIVMTSTLEEDDMLESILWSIIYLYLSMVICMIVVSRLVFRRSLRPFYELMRWLSDFTLGGKNKPLINNTKVSEFRHLNDTIREMAERNELVFQQQKQFIENVSHELQTPLAICRNKLDLLAENPDCTESQLQEIGEVHQSLARMIKLNKSLLLLSRIENRQYADEKEITLNLLIRKQAAELSEIYGGRDIQTEYTEQGEFKCRMNEVLGDVLVTNLLKNAFIHTPAGGTVSVRITPELAEFSNSGESGALDREKIFSRFYHGDSGKSGSTGLGLAIVRAVADTYKLKLTYSFDGQHHFMIRK